MSHGRCIDRFIVVKVIQITSSSEVFTTTTTYLTCRLPDHNNMIWQPTSHFINQLFTTLWTYLRREPYKKHSHGGSPTTQYPTQILKMCETPSSSQKALTMSLSSTQRPTRKEIVTSLMTYVGKETKLVLDKQTGKSVSKDY